MKNYFNFGIAAAIGPLREMTRRFALVKYGGGIVQMSGSIAGNTYARNKSGNYVRSRTKPINPNTFRQVAVRASLSELTERWADTLTGPQRTAWNLYASNVAMTNKLGETIHLSGFNHYIRSNAFLSRYGITNIDAGPVDFTLPGTDPVYAITISEATQVITVTFDDGLAWPAEDNAYMTFLTGDPQNPQRNFFKGPYQGTRFLSGNNGAPLASPLPINGFQVMTETQRVWVQARIYRADGRVSQTFEADAIVAA